MKRTQDFVFRILFINPLLIALLAGLIFCASKASTINLHLNAMFVAAGLSAIASELALIPLLITRGKSQATVSQAGLVSTVIHTMLCAGLGMGASVLLRMGQPLMYWMLLFYWATLVSIAVIAVRAVKSAPIQSNTLLTR